MTFALKGDIVYSKSLTEINECKDSYVICENQKSLGVYKQLPEQYKNIKVYDFTGHLIIPGLVDLHLHAPQYQFIGINMDLQLLDWLNIYTFPEESKYRDIEYAKKAYDIFVDKLKHSATTRAVMFATVHKEATKYLFDKMEESGVVSYIGKVNQDRNSSQHLLEDTEKSIQDTLDVVEYANKFDRTKYIITPRFVPTCTNKLLTELGKIAKYKNLKIQSHLSENLSEIAWVKELVPDSKTYGDCYDMFGLLGEENQAIMAHCIHLDDYDKDLIKKHGTFVAHCPSSNRNLSSGIAPIRRFVDEGINVGLATDVSGGSYLSMFRAIEDCITASKMRSALLKEDKDFVNFVEAFYLATKGGGKFFGKVGSFDKDYEFDALVLDESDNPTTLFDSLSLCQRLERFVYNPNLKLIKKFAFGKEII